MLDQALQNKKKLADVMKSIEYEITNYAHDDEIVYIKGVIL